MIFVTIGTVFPFDRMVRAMDAYAADAGAECVAQIGDGTFRPKHMTWHESLPGNAYKDTVTKADVIVSHAGMGSAITALQAATPIVMLPRKLELGEHNTDHQMATARWLESKPGVFIAWEDADLPRKIEQALAWGADAESLDPKAPKEFTDKLRTQLETWLN